MTLRKSIEERAALQRAKATLDQLGFYPTPVKIDRVRILHVPWLFKLPWFRRWDAVLCLNMIQVAPWTASRGHSS